MKNSFIKNYLQYVQGVLGISSILQPPSAVVLPKLDLLIIVENLKSYSAEESELLQKMIEALKLDATKFQIVDSVAPALPAKYQLILADQESEDSTAIEGTRTYSPRRLLLEPALKKVAWLAMQNALKKIAT